MANPNLFDNFYKAEVIETKASWEALTTKRKNTLYLIVETSEIFFGEEPYGGIQVVVCNSSMPETLFQNKLYVVKSDIPVAGEEPTVIKKGIYIYDGTELVSLFQDVGYITADSIDTLKNKTIDADENSISNLTTENFKAGVIAKSLDDDVTDEQLPTAAAVKKAINAKIRKLLSLQGGVDITDPGDTFAGAKIGYCWLIKKGGVYLGEDFNISDLIVIINDLADDAEVTEDDFVKIDNTEAEDIVRRLTAGTFEEDDILVADDNGKFKSSGVKITKEITADAGDDELATAKAVLDIMSEFLTVKRSH